MKLSYVWICLVVAAVLISPTLARADSAQEAFADGEALLVRADFQGALEAFARAARADRSNQEYLQHYAMVRQVVALRDRLATEQDPQRWEYVARGLHAFYVSQGIYNEALTLDRKIHARLNTAYSAALLAETQLAMDMNAQAAQVLAALDAAKQTAATRALHGLALARQAKTDEARNVARELELPKDADPGTVYGAARLHAAVGNAEHALGLLTRCFESVPPSRLDALKSHVRQSPDFVSVASTAEFAEVLKTESKVPESQCSGGSRCAGCPMRGKCSHSQGR